MNNVELAKFVKGKVLEVFSSKAALAKLRRGVGKELGELPELMGYTFASNQETKPWEDKAIYTALTLYALHQQGTDKFMGGTSVNDEAKKYLSFGGAVRKLVTKDNETAIKRRFDKVLTASDLTEVAVHARGLINLLRNAGIAFDYPGFAVDLVKFQFEDSRRAVIVKWGKDYYFMNNREEA